MKSKNVGDACLAIAAASVLAYTIAALLYAKPGSGFFDGEWIHDGFCVIRKDIPYWNSHDLCLYFDVVLVVIGLAIYQLLKGSPHKAMKAADEMMVFGMLGHLGHGIAHGFIASEYRSGGQRDSRQTFTFERMVDGQDDAAQICKLALGGVAFWCGLLKGVLPKFSMTKLSVLAFFVWVGGLFVREVLAFSYVQAVINAAFIGAQLVLPEEEKGYTYAAFAVSTFVLSMIPWVESTACQTVASKFGGHLIYDVAIPTLLTTSYCTSWKYYSTLHKKEKSV